MKRIHWLSAAAGAVALGMFSVSAQAAPLSGVTGGMKATQGESKLAENVHARRRCWRHRGHWHCRRGHRRAYRYYYSDPYFYRPSIGFWFGSGPRYHHYRHRYHRYRHW